MPVQEDQHLRSIIKGASWRFFGTIDTIILSFIFTNRIDKALNIGGIELFTKIFLFWLHERIWLRLRFGTGEKQVDGETVSYEKHYRSIVKGASWRVIGSMDTFWIALFVNQDAPHATTTAFYIAGTEVITKIGLFWMHERLWMKIKWGRKPLAGAI